MRLVSVVTSARSPRPTLLRSRRAGRRPGRCVGFTSITGSSRPGRADHLLDDLRADGARPGPAWRRRRRPGSGGARTPRSSAGGCPARTAAGSRTSTRVCLRARSPWYIPRICGTEMVRLVDEHQEVVGEVVEQRPGRAAGRAASEVARVVLDAGAVAGFAQRLDVVVRCALRGAGPRAACPARGTPGPSARHLDASMSAIAASSLSREVTKCLAG